MKATAGSAALAGTAWSVIQSMANPSHPGQVNQVGRAIVAISHPPYSMRISMLDIHLRRSAGTESQRGAVVKALKQGEKSHLGVSRGDFRAELPWSHHLSGEERRSRLTWAAGRCKARAKASLGPGQGSGQTSNVRRDVDFGYPA
jgi:hypothetical protein